MSRKERSGSNASETNEMILPSSTESSRGRADSSVKEKTRVISGQLNDTKLEKAKLISRIAKMGQQMMPKNNNNELGTSEIGSGKFYYNDKYTVDNDTIYIFNRVE